MRHAFLVLSLILVPQLAIAQGGSATEDLENLPIPSWAQGIIGSFNEPIHPTIGGIVSGGGIGVGLGYRTPQDERWYRKADGMITLRRYWSVKAEAGRRSLDNRSEIGVFGGVRHMGRLDYYGIGPATLLENRSAFRLRETTLGTRASFRPVEGVTLGGRAAIYLPDLGPDSNPSVASIEEIFPDSSVPGLRAEPTFGRYRAFARFAPQSRAGAYQIGFEAVRDHDDGRYSFHRWGTELQQRIPGFRPGHRLTLHGMLASTIGDDVPFYMLYTLGGSGGLKAFDPELLGGDGTRATLRSFRNYRFRDRDLVLMQAEYRIPVFSHLDASLFVDAGQVAPRTADLFNDVRTGTGFSLSYMRGGRALARVDVGYGSGEGIRVFWSVGAFEN